MNIWIIQDDIIRVWTKDLQVYKLQYKTYEVLNVRYLIIIDIINVLIYKTLVYNVITIAVLSDTGVI